MADIEIKKVVEEYEIKYLVHFTQADNLQSIFKHGLLSVNALEERGIIYKRNDQYRLDGFPNAICLSIQFPNYKMFYKYREQNPEVDWAILGIRKEILWEKQCAFCSDNAASSKISSTSISERMGVTAFKRMYDEWPGKPSRKILGIEKSYPTNPQAEVLVFDAIEPSYNWGVAFIDEETKNKYKKYLPINIKAEVQSSLFKYRVDWEHW